MTSSNHDFMLVMQGNGLAVIHGFVFQPVCFPVLCPLAVHTRWNIKKICQQDHCELSNKTANKVCKRIRDVLFYCKPAAHGSLT